MIQSIRRLILIVAIAGLAPLPRTVAVASPVGEPARPTHLTAAERAEALKQVQEQVRSNYVFPERRAAIAAGLAANSAGGRYDTADPVAFAERVTADLQATSTDTHLYLRYEPDWYRSALLPTPAGEGDKQNRLETEIARYTNYGLVEMKILPGNIRYLKIAGFDWVEDETGPAYDGAMRFLKGGKAFIIDLRGNRGGWVQASKYLISHFLKPDTLIATFYNSAGEPEQYRTIDYLPAGRITAKPVYLLIDGRSRSAAEMVAYTFAQYRVGELVGARTEGAANISDDFPVAPVFRLSVSTGRTVHAATGADWEGVGVAPTIPADPFQALEVAQLHAIDKLLPSAGDGVPRYELEWARPAVQAKLNPVRLTPSQLRDFAGTYGSVSIRFDNNVLWLHVPGRQDSRLTPMTRDGLFQTVDNSALRVRIVGEVLDLLRIDPAFSEKYRKSRP
jgi:hypothetical protein